MSTITFDEDRLLTSAPRVLPAREHKKNMAGTLMSMGIGKTEQEANVVLGTIAVLMIIGAAFLFFQSSREKRPDLPPIQSSLQR